MQEDKYSPKANDNAEKVHQLHVDMIKHHQEENKKVREDKNKPKVEEPVVPKHEEQPKTN